MASLSTVYAISLILGSLAAIGSAFAGTYVYPLQTGGTVGELAEAVKDAATTVNETVTEATTPAEEPLKTEVETQPEVSTELAPAVGPEGGAKKIPSWFRRSSSKQE
jgi:hypothetical protein